MRLVVFFALIAFEGILISLAPDQNSKLPPARPTPPPDTTYAMLGRVLKSYIDTTDWGGGKVTMLVKDASLPITAFAYNEDDAMRPCQLVQIVTAAAALDLLGPNFQFTTELHIAGHADGKQWIGPVIVVGHGDP